MKLHRTLILVEVVGDTPYPGDHLGSLSDDVDGPWWTDKVLWHHTHEFEGELDG